MTSLREQLLEVRQQFGSLTPRNVVEAARPEDHPLHAKVFDKPIEEAAEAYYLDRARRLIQIVRVPYQGADGRPKSVRGLVSFQPPEHPNPVYEPVEEVVQDPLRKQMILQQMEREWRTLKAKYEDVAEFASMVLGDLEGAA